MGMRNMKNNGKYGGEFVYNFYVWLFLTARRNLFWLEAKDNKTAVDRSAENYTFMFRG